MRFLFFILLLAPFLFGAQSDNSRIIDSLKLELKNAKHDTDRCRVLSLLVENLPSNEFVPYNDKLLTLTGNNLAKAGGGKKEIRIYKYYLAVAYGNMAVMFKINSDANSAQNYAEKCLVIRNEIGDSLGIANALYEMGGVFDLKDDQKTALSYYLQSIKMYEEMLIKDLSGYAYSLNNAALSYYHLGETFKALEYLKKCSVIQEHLENKSALASSFGNISAMYMTLGDIPKAYSYSEKALKLHEEEGDKKGMATALSNLGALHFSQNDNPTAVTYFEKSLKIREQLIKDQGLATLYSNLASALDNVGNTKAALEYYAKSLDLNEKLSNRRGLAYVHNGIGHLFQYKGDTGNFSSPILARKSGFEKAIFFYKKGYALCNELNDKKGMALILTNMGFLFELQNEPQKAIPPTTKALSLSLEIKDSERIKDAARCLFIAYKSCGNYALALENYELYIKMNDSLNNENTRKAGIKSQLKYEFEKEAAADSVAHAKESEIKNVELEKQKVEITAKQNQQYVLFGGLGLVIIFAGFMYNRFKITRKQKGIIEEQKEVVEKQKQLVDARQKEILDSIHYAKRIQTALLPHENKILAILNKLQKNTN